MRSLADRTDRQLTTGCNGRSALERQYGSSHRGLAPNIVQALTDITPPEMQHFFNTFTMRPGGGPSVKLGNIRVNTRKVFVALANGTLTAVGVSDAPWMAVWLDPELHDVNKLKELFKPYPSEEMEMYEVSTFVNSPKNESPDCIKPI